MIFVDSNVPMYLVGADHPNKEETRRLLERCITEERRLVTDVEVLQEILHRYVAIRRRDAIQPAWDALLGLVDEVFPLELADVRAARDLVLAKTDLSARDALHLAVMQHRRITTIFSFDSGFDGMPGIRRIPSAGPS